MRESGISTDEPVKVWKMGRGVSAEDAAGSEEGPASLGIADVWNTAVVSARATLGILALKRGNGPACAG